MFRKIALVACVLVFLIAPAAFAPKAHASADTVGVKVGDWAAFDFSFKRQSNITNVSPIDVNIPWADAEVIEVSGTNVTVRLFTIYENGTAGVGCLVGDIATGEGNLSIGIIPPNLGQGSKIPPRHLWYIPEELDIYINGTITRSYAGAMREVNYANVSYVAHNATASVTCNASVYWDRKTGFLCEFSVFYEISVTFSSLQYYMREIVMWEMIATNMWPAVFTAHDGYTFNVTIMSNSTISNFNFNESKKEISFNVTGPSGKTGYVNTTIPKDFMKGPWAILLNGNDWTEKSEISENETHTFIYIPYNCSTNAIQITGTWVVPEFSFLSIVLPPFMITTFSAAIIYRRKRKSNS